jgi:oligopeptide transport system substrate-binding protein
MGAAVAGARSGRNTVLVILAVALLFGLTLWRIGVASVNARKPASQHPVFGRSSPPEDDVFRFANGVEPEMLDPGLMSGQPDGRIARCLFEGLAAPDPRTLDPVPGMARRWDVSADGIVYTFHLRADSRWTNSDRVTARDFEWSWLRVLNPDVPARYADIFYAIQNAQAYKKREITDAARVGIHALDDSTLQVTLAAPTPYFLQLVTYYPFMPVHRATIERWGDRWTNLENIVSNGPFRLTYHRQNDRFVMERFDGYWDARNVRIQKIVAYSTDDAMTIINMYRAGMTDWSPSGYLPAQYIPYARHYEDYRAGPYLGTYFYSYNVTKPPFDNKLVRQALAWAVDRDKITKYLLYDSKTPWGGVVPPGFDAYPYPEGVRFDPDKARRLLAEAGYPGGRGFPHAELLFNSGTDNRRIAEAIQDMWKRNLGIDVELANQEWASYMRSCIDLQYQVARRTWIGDYVDPNTFLYVLRGGDGNNRSGWSNARFDALIEAAAHEMDATKRLRLLADAEAIALDEMPFMPLYSYRTTELVAPYVRGLYPTALDTHPMKSLWFDRGERAAAGAADSSAASAASVPAASGRLPAVSQRSVRP